MKITKEAKTAILVLGAILLFIWGYSFLKGKDLFKDYKTFYVVYKDVEGLPPSAPVTLNGVTIGKVNNMTFNNTPEGLSILVELQINTDFPISKTSSATLYEPGLLSLSGKQVAITPDLDNPDLAEDGDYLKSELEEGMIAAVGDKLAPLQNKVESTVTSADSLLRHIDNIFDQKTQEDLRYAISDMRSTMNEFNKAAHSLNGVISGNKRNIDATLSNLNETTSNFAALSDSLNKADLGQAVKKLEASLNNVDKLISDVESGKGTLGKLMKDEEMYNNLNAASNELKELLADVKNNPKRYVHFSVFGKKGTPYVEEKVEEKKD
ncbi:MlaD family protein [Flavobacterium rhizosphaerae]|uniref:MlaD family protein n=1 Tax=Flavobacterium rhizosphaerae TaxID=3163298 RepID=A0ABW8YWA8_9FLAO